MSETKQATTKVSVDELLMPRQTILLGLVSAMLASGKSPAEIDFVLGPLESIAEQIIEFGNE